MASSSAFVPYTPLPSRRSTTSSPKTRMCEKPVEKPKSKKPIKTVRSNASWANVFLPLFGQKGPGSRPEFDLRPTSIRTDAENPEVCDCCKGCGTMKCSFCSGLTMYDPDGSERRCPACDNKFMVTCSVCFGNKTSIELVR